MENKSLFLPGEIPFGGTEGKFIAMMNKVYNVAILKRKDENINNYFIHAIIQGTKIECERTILNCDRKTAYAYLINTFNAITLKADQMFKWMWGNELNKTTFVPDTEEYNNAVLIYDVCIACEEVFTRIIELLIEQFPEKITQVPGIIQVARNLPNFNYHKQLIERHLNRHESNVKANSFDYEEIYNALRAKGYINKNANKQTFINACLGKPIRYDKRIVWKGSRKACFKLCMILFGDDIKEGEINKIFKQYGLVRGIPNEKDLERNDKSGVNTKGFMTKLLK
jgi:hypothetical protein